MPEHANSSGLLNTVLRPLLEDFQYWFQRSLDLFESETIPFLSHTQQSDLIQRVKTALSEAQTAHALLQATDGQVGVELSQVMGWHQLVSECGIIARRFRAECPRTGESTS